jgi:lysophospholipase L1-like esterase
MKRKIILVLLVLALAMLANQVFSQPYKKEIDQFKLLDEQKAPPVNPILFIGSSSFTIWKDMQNYFPSYTILNRAFGGSTLLNQLYYANEVALAYHPKQIIIYCGENDFATDDAVTADSVYNRFVRLYTVIRNKWPKMPIAYVSMKPSPSRRKYLPMFKVANAKIETYLASQKKTAFINVWDKMLNEDGSFKPEIYLSDSLHMNKNGYAIWQPIIEKYLKK